jgi:large subunit ribosomal protein L20
MTRVKRGVIKNKRRKNVLSQTKGYRFGRSTKEAQAKEAIMHAGAYSFAHRRDKKGAARKLWETRINAALRPEGMSYSKFMGALKKKNIAVDRKILSTFAKDHGEVFSRIVAQVK